MAVFCGFNMWSVPVFILLFCGCFQLFCSSFPCNYPWPWPFLRSISQQSECFCGTQWLTIARSNGCTTWDVYLLEEGSTSGFRNVVFSKKKFRRWAKLKKKQGIVSVSRLCGAQNFELAPTFCGQTLIRCSKATELTFWRRNCFFLILAHLYIKCE